METVIKILEGMKMHIVIDGASSNKDTLSTVYVSDFSDNYHKTDDEPTTELEQAAKSIRRRAKTMGSFIHDTIIYNEYMRKLITKYGSEKIFSVLADNDAIPEFIPPKPRMKNTEFNKFLLKKGILVSEVRATSVDFDDEEAQDLLHTMATIDNDPEKLSMKINEPEKMSKRVSEITERVTNESDYTQLKNIKDMDHMANYFRHRDILSEQQKQDEIKRQEITLSDIIEDKVVYVENDTEDIEEDEQMLWVNDNFTKRSDLKEAQIYNVLGTMGWNPVRMMKARNVSKNYIKMVENNNKKKGKKSKKQDDFFMKATSDNGYSYDSFDAFKSDMLNFSSQNVFGK